MPRIPGAESFGRVEPSARSGRAIASVDTSAVGRGLAGLGNAATVAGQRIADKVEADRTRLQAYDTEARFQTFRFDEAKAYEEATRNMAPGAAAGFADRFTTGFRERAGAFFNTLPDEEKPEYEGKLFGVERELYANGLEFEQGEQRRAAVATVDDALSNAILPRISPTTTPADLNAIIADGNRLIDGNPAFTPIEREEAKRSWRERAQRALVEQLPPEQRGMWLGTEPGDTVDRIVSIESSGNPTARNTESSATGAGQFVSGTWLDMIHRYRPDIEEGKSEAEILALRNDPDLSREMTAAYAEENGRYLGRRGFAASPTNIYLAHFLGPGGAAAVLGADPTAPVENVLGHGQIEANRSVLAGKTAGEVIAWAHGKMEGRGSGQPPILDAIPYEDRVAFAADADAAIVRQRAALLAEQKNERDRKINELMVGIADGTQGLADIRAARQQGWLTDYDDITRATNAYNERNKEALGTAQALTRVGDPTDTFNPFEKADRDAVDLAYKALGGEAGLTDGDADAVTRTRAIVQRSDIVPEAAINALRAGIYSGDADRRANAFNVLDGLYRESPAAVQRAFPEDDIGRLQTYQALAPLLTPEELAARLDPTTDPRTVQARKTLESEGRQEAAKIDTAVILDSFDPGAFSSEPLPPLDATSEAQLRADFDNLYVERYAATGNAETAQQQALERLRLRWGPSSAGDEVRLMSNPPERYYPAVDGDHDWLGQQLSDFVEEQFGVDVQDYGLVATAETEADIAAGRPPGYTVVAIDENGVIRTARAVFDYEEARAAAEQRFMDRRSGRDLSRPFSAGPVLPPGRGTILPDFLLPDRSGGVGAALGAAIGEAIRGEAAPEQMQPIEGPNPMVNQNPSPQTFHTGERF